MEQPTISSTQLAALVGVSYRKVDHWSRQGVIAPTVAATGSGSNRGWTLEDALRAKVIGVLRSAGLSLKAAARFADTLEAEPWLWSRRLSVTPSGNWTDAEGWALDLPGLRAELTERFPVPVSALAG